MKQFKPSCYIQKEEIKQLQFSNTEVLAAVEEKSIRKHSLNRALQLGNLLKNKVDIYFKDVEENLMRVNTTIWGVTTDAVILKQGILIPKNRIVSVD
jgi:hypothetical protein